MATVAEIIADAVRRAGTRFVFGYPGGEIIGLIDAFERAGVRFVAAHHEEAAGFMAMGYSEYVRTPGASLATLGPGAANGAPAAAAALLERAAVLAVTATRDRDASPNSPHQILDLTGLYAAVSKASFAVTSENAASAVGDAIEMALRPRRGPVHLAVSARSARETVDPEATRIASATNRSNGPASTSTSPRADALAAGSRLLEGAHRIAVIVGQGAIDAPRPEAALELIEAIRAPAVTTPKAKGVVPEDHPWFSGTLENAGDDLVAEFLQAADAVVCIGVDSVEFAKPWRLTSPVIHIDDLPSDGYYPVAVEIPGDVAEAARHLAGGGAHRSAWSLTEIAAHRARLDEFLRSTMAGAARPSILRAVDVMDEFRRVLPRDAVVCSDVGANKLLLGQAWRAYRPGTFFVANGLSSMGYSYTAGAGIRLAAPPHLPVVDFVGDGGLTMYLGELETIVRLGLDMLIVVFSDGSLEQIRMLQAAAGLPESGTVFGSVDYVALGRALGIRVFEMDDRTTLRRAVRRAALARGPRMAVAHIDRGHYRF